MFVDIERSVSLFLLNKDVLLVQATGGDVSRLVTLVSILLYLNRLQVMGIHGRQTLTTLQRQRVEDRPTSDELACDDNLCRHQ